MTAAGTFARNGYVSDTYSRWTTYVGAVTSWSIQSNTTLASGTMIFASQSRSDRFDPESGPSLFCDYAWRSSTVLRSAGPDSTHSPSGIDPNESHAPSLIASCLVSGFVRERHPLLLWSRRSRQRWGQPRSPCAGSLSRAPVQARPCDSRSTRTVHRGGPQVSFVVPPGVSPSRVPSAGRFRRRLPVRQQESTNSNGFHSHRLTLWSRRLSRHGVWRSAIARYAFGKARRFRRFAPRGARPGWRNTPWPARRSEQVSYCTSHCGTPHPDTHRPSSTCRRPSCTSHCGTRPAALTVRSNTAHQPSCTCCPTRAARALAVRAALPAGRGALAAATRVPPALTVRVTLPARGGALLPLRHAARALVVGIALPTLRGALAAATHAAAALRVRVAIGQAAPDVNTTTTTRLRQHDLLLLHSTQVDAGLLEACPARALEHRGIARAGRPSSRRARCAACSQSRCTPEVVAADRARTPARRAPRPSSGHARHAARVLQIMPRLTHAHATQLAALRVRKRRAVRKSTFAAARAPARARRRGCGTRRRRQRSLAQQLLGAREVLRHAQPNSARPPRLPRHARAQRARRREEPRARDGKVGSPPPAGSTGCCTRPRRGRRTPS